MKRRRVVFSPPRSWFALAFALSAAFTAAACGEPGSKSACEGLVYKEYGLNRAEYLPCVGEMLSAIDTLRGDLEPALRGDARARQRARTSFARLQRLMSKAGGRNLLERGADEALVSLNVDLQNAASGYEAILTPMGMTPMTPELARAIRESDETDFRHANESADSARRIYDSLR